MNDDLTLIKYALTELGIGGNFNPITSPSSNYSKWVTNFKPTTCAVCADLNGKVFDGASPPEIEPPIHDNCNCMIISMTAIKAGTATTAGFNGADLYLQNGWGLPQNYLTKAQAEQQGYKDRQGNLADVLPGANIGGDIYENKNEKLPISEGRTWQEVDINYLSGFRNGYRILYSNDGLIFVTYDHYETFYEIN